MQLTSDIEVLDPAPTRQVPALSGPQETIIDNETGAVSFSYRTPELMLADANRQLVEAQELVPLIDSDTMYTEAAELLAKVVGDWKGMDEDRLSSTKPLREKVDQINGDFKPAIELRQQAERLLKEGIAGYMRKKEQERLRLQREAEARAAAERRKAEAEAAELRRQAEARAATERREAEERAAEERRKAEAEAEEKRKLAQAAAENGDADAAKQLQAQAAQIVETGNNAAQNVMEFAESQATETLETANQQAESLHQVSTMVTASAVEVSTPKVKGLKSTVAYSAEVTDPKAFLAFVVENFDTMSHYVTIEQGKLNTLAQNQKERFSIAGCELRQGARISSGRR